MWWFNKTITCSTTAFAAIFYCVIIVRNRKEKKETGRADDNNTAFEIKIANPSSPNIHNGKVFAKNSLSASPNNVPLTSKVGQVVSHLSKQSASNALVKSRNKKLFSIQLKTEKGCNSIVLNNSRFFTHDDSNETIILNNIAFPCESGFGNMQDNLNHSLIIHIDDSSDLTNNKTQIKIFNKPIKQSMQDVLSISTNCSTNNRSANSIMISQNENQGIGITISPFNNRHIVNPIITFRGNRSTNTNQWTKEIEKNDVTVIINAPV
ncbi:uncharacterized protein LOC114941702 [Nylanderia fulva]|uniref:uncharacterized protein LOC114941702 n=1 Tax=Nylanderia fulva TaxID=613905 RepID=UPI0010FB1B59|nr:uncharacterized protein LOC114941702 [Nylanderia fulva]